MIDILIRYAHLVLFVRIHSLSHVLYNFPNAMHAMYMQHKMHHMHARIGTLLRKFWEPVIAFLEKTKLNSALLVYLNSIKIAFHSLLPLLLTYNSEIRSALKIFSGQGCANNSMNSRVKYIFC